MALGFMVSYLFNLGKIVFILVSILSAFDYMKFTGDKSFEAGINLGFDYYIKNFFTDEGIPKYYNNDVFPIDIHSPAQLVVTVKSLGRMNQYRGLIDKVINWTVNNMRTLKVSFIIKRISIGQLRFLT